MLDEDYEKRVEKYASKVMDDVESKNKLFGLTMTQVADIATIGDGIESNILRLNDKIRELDPSKVDFSVRSKIII